MFTQIYMHLSCCREQCIFCFDLGLRKPNGLSEKHSMWANNEGSKLDHVRHTWAWRTGSFRVFFFWRGALTICNVSSVATVFPQKKEKRPIKHEKEWTCRAPFWPLVDFANSVFWSNFEKFPRELSRDSAQRENVTWSEHKITVTYHNITNICLQNTIHKATMLANKYEYRSLHGQKSTQKYRKTYDL